MSLNRFQQRMTTAEELKALIGEPGELVIRKQLSELDHHMQAFIAESPFLLLGTYDRDEPENAGARENAGAGERRSQSP